MISVLEDLGIEYDFADSVDGRFGRHVIRLTV